MATVRVVFVPAPDLSDLPFVPPVARPWVRQACVPLQRRQGAAAESAGGVVAPISADLARVFAADAALFSPDRYHPSSAGYASIAEALEPYIVAAACSRAEAERCRPGRPGMGTVADPVLRVRVPLRGLRRRGDFLFPWATIFADPGFGTTALVEMGVFVGLLALVLVYVWRKRVLTWT